MKVKTLFICMMMLYAFSSSAYALTVSEIERSAIKAGVPADQVYSVVKRAKAAHVPDSSISEMVQLLVRAKENNVPITKMTNKILEGISKNVKPEIIVNTCNRLEHAYKQADLLYKEIRIKGTKTGELKDAMAMAIFNGVDAGELKNLYLSAPGSSESYYLIGTVSLTSLIATGMGKEQSISFIKRAFIEHKSAEDIQNESMKLMQHNDNNNGLSIRQERKGANKMDMNRMNMPEGPTNSMPVERGMNMHNPRN
ncbi:MAG: hypothetical protein ACP5QW_08735 [bacterium]